ncbi:hypothetical protein HK097_000059 [Rhizophlyctis rosea]|uniref:Uncharacterized protein n=1 Tax=Rhizophlyctis rosea TaxID=64517 RepID=A0AAD5SJW3_9FUNG|nr:hypothetical protein HK097_000059 [Rhizophlyctis rosea]
MSHISKRKLDEVFEGLANLEKRDAVIKLSDPALLDRISTFKALTWFGKPNELSPPVCALHGWINVDLNTLSCPTCSKRMIVRIPEEANADESDEAFKSRYQTFGKQISEAPLTRFDSASSAPTEDDIQSIANRFLPETTLDDATKHAVTLAMFGWELCQELGRAFASCRLCARKAGLWNYDRVEERSEKRVRRDAEAVDGQQSPEDAEDRKFDPEMEHRYGIMSH